MKKTISNELIECRLPEGDPLFEGTAIPVGAFRINNKKYGELLIIASMGLGWDHVSVSLWNGDKNKIPTWEIMCYVKDLFFDPEETVIQYHPPKSKYVNFHSGVLHLWRPQNQSIPLPPLECV